MAIPYILKWFVLSCSHKSVLMSLASAPFDVFLEYLEFVKFIIDSEDLKYLHNLFLSIHLPSNPAAKHNTQGHLVHRQKVHGPTQQDHQGSLQCIHALIFFGASITISLSLS